MINQPMFWLRRASLPGKTHGVCFMPSSCLQLSPTVWAFGSRGVFMLAARPPSLPLARLSPRSACAPSRCCMHVALRWKYIGHSSSCTAAVCVTEANGWCCSTKTQDKSTIESQSSVKNLRDLWQTIHLEVCIPPSSCQLLQRVRVCPLAQYRTVNAAPCGDDNISKAPLMQEEVGEGLGGSEVLF